MLVKRIAACTHLSSTVYEPILLDIGQKLQLFPTPFAFNAPVGGKEFPTPPQGVNATNFAQHPRLHILITPALISHRGC